VYENLAHFVEKCPFLFVFDAITGCKDAGKLKKYFSIFLIN